ncbi:hypothetical protein ACWHY4_09860 [Pseudomonas sp. E2-15]
MNTLKLYFPLLLIEAYLFLGLWLLFFGPIAWPLVNKNEFLSYIFLYHACFITGYLSYTVHFHRKTNSDFTVQQAAPNTNELFTQYFWTIVIFALAANIILYRNLTLSNSFFPNDIFFGLYRGLVTPWEARAYFASDAASAGFIKMPFVTALLIFIAPFKYILLPGLVFFWHTLSTPRKIAGVLVATLPILAGITASLSAINFSYLFIITICLGALIASEKSGGFFLALRKRKFFVISLVLIFFFSFWQFYSVKSGKNPYQVSVENSKPQSFEFLKEKGIHFKSETPGAESSNTVDFYEKLTAYMVQGYYGMSIALSEDFDSSYGIGHSVFLQKIFADHLGIDVSDRTYQHKITDRWDEFVYWHSFYSYLANDVGFFGVALVMLVIGAYFSNVYLSAIKKDNFYSKMLLPLFGLLFFYIPANNQVFGFLETMISFWVLTVLFFISKRTRANTRLKTKDTQA